jgi:hypothetical protein
MLWRNKSPPDRKHSCACYLLYNEYLLASIISPEDGSDKFFLDVVWLSAE